MCQDLDGNFSVLCLDAVKQCADQRFVLRQTLKTGPHHLVCNSRQRADSVAGSGASTLVLMAGVRSAGVALVVVMVGAVDFGIKDELSGQIVGHGTVGQAGNAAEQLDAGLHQSDVSSRC